MRGRLLVLLLWAVVCSAPVATLAQAPVPFPPGFDAAQAAFLPLPPEEKRAIQLDLVWTGDFNGTATGDFGRLTFQGLTNFQRRQRQTPNAILDPAQRRALQAAANAERQAVKFDVRTDERTAARVGLPMLLVDSRTNTATGSLWAARDGRFTLETFKDPSGPSDLATLFEATKQSTDKDRKVTYSVHRPDLFFVVSGSIGTSRKFYTHVSKRGSSLIGYTVTWMPDRLPNFDRVNVAIANAFDPSPTSAPPVATPPGPGPVATTAPGRPPTTLPPGASAPPPAPVATQSLAPAPAPAGTPAGTAVIVAPGVAVAPLASVDGCRTLGVGPLQAKVSSSDQSAGLAVLALNGVPMPTPIALSNARPADGAPLLFLGQGVGGLALAPSTAARSSEDRLTPMIALQPGQAGGALVDRSGQLVGLVLGPERTRVVSIAGVVAPATQRVVEVLLLAKLVNASPAPSGPTLDTGAIAARVGPSVLPISCVR